MSRVRSILGLTAVYLVLTGNFQWSNIIIGLLIATFVSWALRIESRPVSLRSIPSAVWAVIQYAVTLTVDLIISGLQVARIVLTPKMPIEQGNIAIPTQCKSETGQALSAHAITLTPGEMVVEMGEKGVMFTHSLDATRAEGAISEAQHKRDQMLIKIMP